MGYARSLKFPAGEAPQRYLLDAIPYQLWRRVRARCKREQISVRAVILELLTKWLEEEEGK